MTAKRSEDERTDTQRLGENDVEQRYECKYLRV